jgi:hypothetical protein
MKEIDKALQQGNMDQLIKLLGEAKTDITGLCFIEIMDELKNRSVDLDGLRTRGAILDLEQLRQGTEKYLGRIEEHPEERVYLKRLYAGWQTVIANWIKGEMQNKEACEAMDKDAVDILHNLQETGQLNAELAAKVQGYLGSLSEEEHKNWIENKLEKGGQLERLDATIEKSLFKRWAENRAGGIPEYTQMISNIQKVMLDGYKTTGGMADVLLDKINGMLVATIIGQITSTQIDSGLWTNINALAQTFTGGKPVIIMTPYYERAMTDPTQGIIHQWKRGMVSVGISEILNKLVQSILVNLSLDASEYEQDFRTRVEKEAVKLLIKQLKGGELSKDLHSKLFDETKNTLTSLEPTQELPKIALSSLLTDWRKYRGEESWQMLDKHLLGDKQRQLLSLRGYAYPSLMVREMAELRQQNATLAGHVKVLTAFVTKKMSTKEREALQQELTEEAKPTSPRATQPFTMFGGRPPAPAASDSAAEKPAPGPSHS